MHIQLRHNVLFSGFSKYTNRTSRSKLAVEQSGQVQAKPSGSRALSGESQGLDGSDSDDSDDAQVKRKNESAVFDAIWAAARGGSESIKTRKARIYSVSGNKKYGTTKRTPLRPPAHPEPSSRDNSDECAASLHSNSNSADDAPKPIKTKGLKRNMSRLPQKASAASKAKRSRHHSETNVRKSVVTAQESLDEPMHSRPVFRVDTSDVVRDAAESDTNKFGDNGVNGDNCQNSDSSAQAEERKEPVIFDVKWDASSLSPAELLRAKVSFYEYVYHASALPKGALEAVSKVSAALALQLVLGKRL
ncbi:uncharacterized protein LOC129593717 isoform X2 [Paramacrobiotus metropolitanus]|uniref:uncharacterized protein LOC129593717 isoform X2 n=1 Tax=Paramacrobiotus metropolitanus TaxID=2943436 RepID=UPI0024457C8B|nr:uncharacterized protein LOC129593717 isoform X2 [Paramacrobiotus metropolitanus]